LKYAAAAVCVGVVDKMTVSKYDKAYSALRLIEALATWVDMNDDVYCLENILGAVA
jgi:hypothetical protein